MYNCTPNADIQVYPKLLYFQRDLVVARINKSIDVEQVTNMFIEDNPQ